MTVTAPVRVLTAEDDPIVRAELRAILEEDGFDVCDARDGEEAVRVARAARPDLILMDLSLPRLDGVEAAKRIRAERAVPFVAITGHRDTELVRRARREGATTVVHKPYPDTEIIAAVREAIADATISRARAESLRALEDLTALLGYDRAFADSLEQRAFRAGQVWKRVQ